MKVEIIAGLLTVITGAVTTRIYIVRRNRNLVARQLARWSVDSPEDQQSPTLLKKSEWTRETVLQFLKDAPGIPALQQILIQAGLEGYLFKFLSLSWVLLLAPPVAAGLLGLDMYAGLAAGIALPILAVLAVKHRAASRRQKFCEQLPDAIDLMIAVLKSGHSVPQAVQSVAQEIPSPCGTEFQNTLHRMNLGQRLSEAMIPSAQRFDSYELDLIRRAVGIQAEVGGSLAELLDKTNSTLRDRLKLVRQARAITAQSRLTALIVGVLPAVMAAVLTFMHPGYLQRFAEDDFGRTLLFAAIGLEILGVLIMRRIADIKV